MQFELTNTKHDAEDENPIEWVKWFEGMKEEGEFSIESSRLSFREGDQPVFFIINEEKNIGTSVFCSHHPNAKFTDSTPHGVRLANAIGRAFDLEGDVSASELCDLMNDQEKNPTIKVEKTEKGVLWSVILA